MEIVTNTIVDHKLRIVSTEVYAVVGNYVGISTGSSRCSGPDKFDPKVGEQLAVARAIKDLGRKIEKNARSTVAERDKVRELAEAARIKNLKERKARGKKLKLQSKVKNKQGENNGSKA